jgi:exodeoxyribonuclease III
VLSLLTLNIQAAALTRARALLRWMDTRTEELFILTETSSGPGTAHLLDQCRQAGLTVVQSPIAAGDRGVAMLSRVPIVTRPDLVAGVTLPGRVAAGTIAGDPELTVVGVYVPSSDRAPDKVSRKRDFVASLLGPTVVFPPPSGRRWCSAVTTTSSPVTISRGTRASCPSSTPCSTPSKPTV